MNSFGLLKFTVLLRAEFEIFQLESRLFAPVMDDAGDDFFFTSLGLGFQKGWLEISRRG